MSRYTDKDLFKLLSVVSKDSHTYTIPSDWLSKDQVSLLYNNGFTVNYVYNAHCGGLLSLVISWEFPSILHEHKDFPSAIEINRNFDYNMYQSHVQTRLKLLADPESLTRYFLG
jgi:hypothetical protein